MSAFGELLPEAEIGRAQALAQTADLIVCIGSSLTVHPVAGLPDLVLASGGRVAIVTDGPTPFDDVADVVVGGDVVVALEQIRIALG